MAGNRFKKLDSNKTKEIVGTAMPTENIENEAPVKESIKTADGPAEVKKANSKKPKKTMSNEKKKEYEKFGVSVREDLKEKVELLGKNSNDLKPNTVVVNLLSELFDGKNFTVDFEAKSDTKVTSYNIPTEMLTAIDKINKKTKLPKSEIFNRLLEEALKNYY